MADFLTVKKQNGLVQISLANNWIFANLNELQAALDAIDPGNATEARIFMRRYR